MFQALESRRLFSASVISGVLTVTGTSSANIMSIGWNLNTTTGVRTARVDDGSTVSNFNWTSTSNFSSVVISSAGGNDTIYGDYYFSDGQYQYLSPVPMTFNGEAGNDTLYGSQASDTLNGGSSNDSIYGFSGNDSLYGSDGADTMYGGYGSDVLNAISDSYVRDSLYGGNEDATGGVDSTTDYYLVNGTAPALYYDDIFDFGPNDVVYFYS